MDRNLGTVWDPVVGYVLQPDTKLDRTVQDRWVAMHHTVHTDMLHESLRASQVIHNVYILTHVAGTEVHACDLGTGRLRQEDCSQGS